MSKKLDLDAVLVRARELGATSSDFDGRRLSPMLAERATSAEILTRPGWTYELKLDGVRILADSLPNDVRLSYRRGRDATASYPEIAQAISAWSPDRLLLDGEVVAFDAHGRPSFERLSHRIQLHREADVRAAARATPVVYVVFDLLAVGGLDLRLLPLSSRRELLRAIIPEELKEALRVQDWLAGDGRPLFELCRRERLEGVVAKRSDAPYRAGIRSPDWQKLKCETDDEFVVIGWTRGTDGGLGALDLGSYEGSTLMVRGEVGSGLHRRTATMLLERFAPLTVSHPSASGEYERDPARTHLRPEVVVSVRYLSWSESGRLRFPTFRGVRDEIEPRECSAAPEPALPLAASALVAVPAASAMGLEEYYARVSGWLLPYLADRPIVLTGQHAALSSGPRSTEAGGERMVMVDDQEGLRLLAAVGPMPLRVRASRATNAELAEWLTLALDGTAAELSDLVGVAQTLRELLVALGLTPVAKSGGSRVLHVMANVGAVPWEPLVAFARVVAALLVGRCGGCATLEPGIPSGRGRVWVDSTSNGSRASVVAPLSVLEGDLVSAPLAWDEVTADLDPSRWTIRTTADRLRSEVTRSALSSTLEGISLPP